MGFLTAFTAAETLGETADELRRIERALRRERKARSEAEAIAERGLRDLYLSQQRIELLQRVATIANQAGSMREALTATIQQLCEFTDWVFANVYVTSSETGRIVPANIWYCNDPENLMSFIEVSLKQTFASGEGLPGRVHAAARAEWISDLSVAENFLRREVAAEVGLNAAFAFPVLVGQHVEAVVEFFARPNFTCDEDLLSLASQIGTQLGRVIERERFNAKLLFDALHDPLTGLPNRALFMDRVNQALERQKRHNRQSLAVLFIDLDGFKFVNDSLGHQAGDRVLVSTAKRLEAVLEQCDPDGSPRPAWTLARMGGDEFTVVLEDFGDPEIAQCIAEQLLAAVIMAHDLDGTEVHSGASIGIAFARSEGVTALDLLRKADTAMYAAKNRGRGQIAAFDDELRARAQERLETEQELRRAIRRGEFRLMFQPIVDLATNRLVGFEALLRWERRPGEIVGPAAFIDIAEETGLIVAIGDWVLAEGCAAAARWNARFPDRALVISINVSPRQLLQPNFIGQVRKALSSAGAAPGMIALEITEGVAITKPERAIEIMRELGALGVKISLDDFGTGYSSLGHLHRYPFDTLKLDRSFVSGLDDRDRARGVVRAVLDLALTMNMRVVAEGIETEGQRDHLRAMGCDYAQGFFYSRPLAPDAAERLIAAS